MTAALIERLEAATEGSGELSAHVVKAALFPADTWVEQSRFNGVWCIYERPEKPRVLEVGGALRGASVTESVDAALALAEQVLPGLGSAWDEWLVEVTRSPNWRRELAVTWDCCVSDGCGVRGANVKSASSGPLALCIAILKATTAADAGSVGIAAGDAPSPPRSISLSGEAVALTPEMVSALKAGDVLRLAGGWHMTRFGRTSHPDRDVTVREVTKTHIKFMDGSGWALSNGLKPLSLYTAPRSQGGEGL